MNTIKRTKHLPFSLQAILHDAMTDAEDALLLLQDKIPTFTNFSHCTQLDGTGGYNVYSYINNTEYLHLIIIDYKTRHKLIINHYKDDMLLLAKETVKQREFNALAKEYIQLLISI
jgi:hypothetical protein